MITPSPAFSTFITNVNTMIGEVYDTTIPLFADQVATTIPISTHFLLLGWTTMLDKFRVWNGPRYTKEPAPATQIYEVLPYELTIALDRFRMDDDTSMYGIYYRIFADMARQAKRWADYELRDMIEDAGAYTPAYRQAGLDGGPAFSTSHPVDLYNAAISSAIGSTYCNDFTGGGVTVTYNKTGGTFTTLVGGAFSPTAFATLAEYMRLIPAEDGEAWGITPNKLMHAPQLQQEVELVLKSTFFAPAAWGTIGSQVGAADNPLRRFGVEPLVNPLLKTVGTWYLMDTTKALKPFIWGLHTAPQWTPRVNENDPIVFDEHRYTWGAWGRATPAWGFSQTFARSGA